MGSLLEELAEYPLCQYEQITTDQIPFSKNVRHICKTECPRYGTSWSCPPAVGTVEECRARCLQYKDALIFMTASEVDDMENMDALLATRKEHEAVTHQLDARFREEFGDCLTLSSESCADCAQCAYPSAPCRNPGRMLPCLEGYGIVAVNLAELCGMPMSMGPGVVVWFGAILFHRVTEKPGVSDF